MSQLLRTPSEDLTPYISSVKATVDAAIEGYLNNIFEQAENVREASIYTVRSGGHRWRPMLLLTAGQSYGASNVALLPMACVVELLHTAAMILDDLPCMDDARVRHGQPTCHKVYGEDATILASHFLLTNCYEIVRTNYPPQCVGELTLLISDMIRGQAADVSLYGREAEVGELEQVYRLKSGRLAGFSAKMGGMLANASAAEIGYLEQFGETLGVSYQVLDDLFDANGGPATVGKEPGKDKGKSTFVSLLGTAGAMAMTEIYKDQALSNLELITCGRNELVSLAEYVVPISHQ